MWNMTQSDPSIQPYLNITSTYNKVTKLTSVETDIIGFLSNSKIPTTTDGSAKMTASSAWMTYPISLYDATKMNFTLSWDTFSCPQSVNSPINCSPQGGFAIVFQQESPTALGEYKNNLGQGMGYEGLSGILAIEFDTFASVHNGQPINNNLMVSVKIRNSNTMLLSSLPTSIIAQNIYPTNFASFNRSDFMQQNLIEVGLIPNQLTQQLILSVFINGIPQIQTTTTYSQLGINPNRVYYFGFTGAQNLNPNVATGTLSFLNIRVFKPKPKFVDGQVSFLYDYSSPLGNNSYLEVRSSFYDVCMQKTTMIVYPTVTLQSWQNQTDSDPRILCFTQYMNIFVTDSIIEPLNKPLFYKPQQLYLNPDVTFAMSIPTKRTTAIRMGFYWGFDLIMNVTAIDYFRQESSSSFAFISIANSDIITNSLAVSGYVNNNYQFTVYCYDYTLNYAIVAFSQLQLTVTSDYIRLNKTQYTNIVPMTCYGVQAQNGNLGGQTVDTYNNYQFSCTFLPNVNGTYYINSPFFTSGKSYSVQIASANQVTTLLSSQYSQAILQGNYTLPVGSTIQVYIDLRDYLNNTYNLSPNDGCSLTSSYYTQNGQKSSFMYYDNFPYLSTVIINSGVADFSISISCTNIGFNLQCNRCQKIIQPLNQFFSYQVYIPSYPSQFSIPLYGASSIMLQQASNLVIDIYFYDQYQNLMNTMLSNTQYSEISAQLIYFNRTQSRTFTLTKSQMAGTVMLQLTPAQNLFFKSLPPRANTYFLSIQVPSQQLCSSIDTLSLSVFLVSQDKLYPIETVGDQDQNILQPQLSSIQWDRYAVTGKIGRFSFTLRNPNIMQMGTWPSQTISDFLSANLVDQSGNVLQNCTTLINFGLYQGEYLGWFFCSTAFKNAYLQLQYLQGPTTTTLQAGNMFPIGFFSSNASIVDQNFYQTPLVTGPLTVGSGGLNITFRIYDQYMNMVDNLLVNRDQPHLGVITYNITSLDTGAIAKFSTLSVLNASAFMRIVVDNMVIGNYRLQLNFPNPITTDFKFVSSSTVLSPIYSYALRDNSASSTVAVNSYITLRVYAANIHNQTIVRNADSALLLAQCRMYIQGSNGYNYNMNFGGTFNDLVTGQIYYNFTTTEALNRNGNYMSMIYFPSFDQYLYVKNGSFIINDKFDPMSSELYLVKGIEQKEFRMIQYDPLAGLSNSLNASHYDPRIDGSLRFKMYLRTNINNNMVTNADFTNVQFQNAYIASAQYSSSFTIQTNYSGQINLSVQNINNNYLLIGAATWADQNLITALSEGYYFIFVTGTQFNTPFRLIWLFSLYNSNYGPQLTYTNMNFYHPRFVNITAGEPFTFVVAAFGSALPQQTNVIVVSNPLLSLEIDQTGTNLLLGQLYYITMYHETAGTYYPQLKCNSMPITEIVVQVNPAPFYQVQVLDLFDITTRTVTIGTPISYNFTFIDRYGNNIFQYQRERPTIQRISEMVQIVHQNRSPVIKFVRAVNSTVYQANFTTMYVGSVSLVVPLTSAANSQTLTQNLANITFTTTATAIPNALKTYAYLVQKTSQAGNIVQLQIKLLDQYGNKISTPTSNTSFVVNAVPQSNCNTTTSVMQFISQTQDALLYQTNLTRVCLYNVMVHYYSSVDGHQPVSCLNCFLRVTPAVEEYRKFDFLDIRDTLVSAFGMQTLYINKYDWNPKIIMIMRDLYGNVFTPNSFADLTYNYTFDIVQTGTSTVLKSGTWTQIMSFHMLSFCNEATNTNFCMLPQWSTAQLRVRQVTKLTGVQLGIALINVQFIDNLGTFYNLDQINPLSANFTYIKMLNQDASEVLGQDMAVIPDKCIGGYQYPLIGRIEFRTVQGFRFNDSFADIQSRISIQIANQSTSMYQVYLFPGSTQGVILFAIFVGKDFYLDQESAIATIYIDGQPQAYKNIVIQCLRRMNYNKYIQNTNGTNITYLSSFPSGMTIQAGTPLSFNITGLLNTIQVQPNATQFTPYDQLIYVNYTSISYPITASTALDTPLGKVTIYNFTQITKAGNASIVGSGIPDNFAFNFTVIPGPISALQSQVSNEQFKIVAGTNATIFVSLADMYGNVITLTNSTNDIQSFNNNTQVYYAKIGSKLHTQLSWLLVPKESCFAIIQGRMMCSVTSISQKGLYKWRVIINGEIAQGLNCYVRVAPTGRVIMASTVMGDLSQNYYQNQAFAMGKFNVLPVSNYVYFKYYLKDEFQNVYIHEDPVTVDTMSALLVNTTLSTTLTIIKIGSGKASNAQIYKVTAVQSAASSNAYSRTLPGQYQIRISTNLLGPINFPLLIQASVSSPGYSAPAGSSLVMYTREPSYMQTAGQILSVQFGIYANGFLLTNGSQSLTQVQFTLPLITSQSQLQNGNQIVSQYWGQYEKFQMFTSIAFDQPSFQEKFTITINGFDPSTQGQLFQTMVFPNTMTQILYSSDRTSFSVLDTYGNNVEFTQDPYFSMQVISLNNAPTSQPPAVLASDFQIKMNYTQLGGVIVPGFANSKNISAYTIIDSSPAVIPKAFLGYMPKNIVDYGKSSFNYSIYHTIAGSYFQIQANLIDSFYQPINLTNTLSNIYLKLIYPSNDPTVYTRRINRTVSFSGAKITASGAALLSLQFNYSSYYSIEVKYNDIKLVNANGQSNCQWVYVDVNPATGVSSNQQYTITTSIVQKNQISPPMITSQGLTYTSLMKSQPIFIINRLGDQYGNYFYSQDIYKLFFTGDLSLQARLKNYGGTNQWQLNSSPFFNIMVVQAFSPETLSLYNQLVPSYFPLISNQYYSNQKSYIVDVYSPSNSSQSINLSILYLVVTSDFAVTNYHSVNVSDNQNISLSTSGIYSSSFNGGLSMKIRQFELDLLNIAIRNTDSRPYLAETITNFTMKISNTTVQQVISNGKITTIYLPLTTINMTIIPYQNDAFFRLLLNSSTLYQNSPLDVLVSVNTQFSYAINPQQVHIPLWVFPPTPPNYLNPIVNTSYLNSNQTMFQPATKITFNLVLQYNGTTYMNDLQSASRIIVFRGSAIEQVTAVLNGSSSYSVSVNLEGPQTNYFRIYYQNTDNSLYPLTTPDLLVFQINTGSPILSSTYLSNSMFESFYYEKLGLQEWMQSYPILQARQLQAYNPQNLTIILLSNLINSNGVNTYLIGNNLLIPILLVDNSTSRCLLSTDYNPMTDLSVVIQGYNPANNAVGPISIDISSIQLVQKIVNQPSSYCAFYSVATLESQDQLSIQGNYSLTATFLQTKASTNLTFQAVIGGIDFTKTSIGWYLLQSSDTYQSQSLIAQFNAYDQFNYLIFFQDVLGNYVSDRQQEVKIQINFKSFGQNSLNQGTDYTYISRYDDRFKGYLITITFTVSGTFQPEYYFNLQLADAIQITNGPVLFVVGEPQCISVQVLSVTSAVTTNNAGVNTVALMMGQLFSVVFHCFDINNLEITQNIANLQATAIFTNLNNNDQQIFVGVDSLQNGLYRVSYKFYQEGTYTLKVYFNNLLIYQNPNSTYSVISDLCRDPLSGNKYLSYRCPNNPMICASSYQECPYINTTVCPDILAPFLCGGPTQGPDHCKSNMQSECCLIGGQMFPDYKWCPHINQCFNSSQTTCQSIISNTQPSYYCNSLKTFVYNRTQCCGDFYYNVTIIQNGMSIQVPRPMVKCSQEDKCVPQNTAEFCFFSFQRNCLEIFGPQFSYQCPNDGKCHSSPLECPSSRVCPPGYTQCPDYTCIAGLNSFNQCNQLQNCTQTLPDGSIVDYIRCPDSSCSKTYEDCPSQVSCMIPGQVVCPDGSCQNSQYNCIQPIECTMDQPYKCPGFPSVCAQSANFCPQPSSKSCGGQQSLCSNGDCSSQCLPSTAYFVTPSQSYVNSALQLSSNCSALGLVQCPNNECRGSYLDCSDTLFCPIPINQTFSPQAIICPSAQVCALYRQDCSYSQCQSTLDNLFLPSQISYDSITVQQASLATCYDGRCHIQGRQKQEVCMTPFSCSNTYVKSGGFGEFCVSTTNTSQSLMELSILLNDYKCQSNKVKCVTGECRFSFDDCPSLVTCPSNLPVQCRDGQCVMSKTLCRQVDQTIEANLLQCYSKGLLLCTSDLITCTTSLSQCPTRTTCPIGYIKCWDQSCVNLEKQQSCPPVVNSKIQMLTLSTCHDQFSFPFHCFSDGSCRQSLSDCPSISYCPLDRPVKCASDKSCRKSVKNCPIVMNCPPGYKFCAGEATCVQVFKPCGTVITCPVQQPFKCEDGSCVQELGLCFQLQHSISSLALSCIDQPSNYICLNNKTQCSASIMQCPSSKSCQGALLVKGIDQLCYGTRDQFSIDITQESSSQYPSQCYLSNMYKCRSDGQCSHQPCQEWTQCQNQQQMCWDGQCVSNLNNCRSPITGCPVYAPYKCANTANCVSNQSYCDSNSTVELVIVQNICIIRFNLSVSCPFDGSCASSLSKCPTAPQSCYPSYPNQITTYGNQFQAQCYIPQCPEPVPFKCPNGLCVLSKENCPLNPFSVQEIKACTALSNFGFDFSVPCGNGQCAESSDQCPPLYECSMNLNSQAFFRCPDGVCRYNQSQCPQYISSISMNVCPSYVPFMCSNGMCALTQGDCLKNENGCPQSLPYKCKQTGQCTHSLAQCQNPMMQMTGMFIYPNYIPPISPTPLTAVYGITRSICQAKGQFTCRIGNDLPFCVDRLDDCIPLDNNCPVNNPIRCGNQCLTSYFACSAGISDNCTATNSARCPSVMMTSGQCANNMTDFSNCQTQQGCPLVSQSFQCAPQQNIKSLCGSLPYTTFSSLQPSACLTYNTQQTSNPATANNDCTSSDAPYSCADGSCAANLGMCPTCIFYCSLLQRCVRSINECQFVMSQATNLNVVSMVQQSCPMSTPIRCILTGQCVSSEMMCSYDQLLSNRMSYNYTFSGSLLSQKCPFLSPVKCQDGRCVQQYDKCISLQRYIYTYVPPPPMPSNCTTNCTTANCTINGTFNCTTNCTTVCIVNGTVNSTKSTITLNTTIAVVNVTKNVFNPFYQPITWGAAPSSFAISNIVSLIIQIIHAKFCALMAAAEIEWRIVLQYPDAMILKDHIDAGQVSVAGTKTIAHNYSHQWKTQISLTQHRHRAIIQVITDVRMVLADQLQPLLILLPRQYPTRLVVFHSWDAQPACRFIAQLEVAQQAYKTAQGLANAHQNLVRICVTNKYSLPLQKLPLRILFELVQSAVQYLQFPAD